MEDDAPTRSTYYQEAELSPAGERGPSPEEELDADIQNLSIEDSPAGPVIRIPSQEVTSIPDTQPLHDNNDCYEKALDVNLAHNQPNIMKSTSDSCLINTSNLSNNDGRYNKFSIWPTRFTRRTDSNTATQTSTTDNCVSSNDTPYTSATDNLTNTTSTATLPKRSSALPSKVTYLPETPRGCRKITQFLLPGTSKASSSRNPPNICVWNDKDTSTEKSNTNVASPDCLPPRQPRKRARHSTNEGSTKSSAAHNSEERGHTTNHVTNPPDETNQISSDVRMGPPVPNTPIPVTHTKPANNTKNVSFSLQNDENGDYLPVPAEGLPFSRRARGCFSAEARAVTRADHLDRLADNGKPARWAFGIGPMPPYMKTEAKDLVSIRRRHSLEFTRAVARSLRDSALTSRRQGKLNLDTVDGIYAKDGAGFERASTKLTALVSRDNSQEAEKLTRREELITRSPTTDDDIVNHLSCAKVSSRSYAAVVANDPPQPDNQNQPNRADNRNGQARQNPRSRSRSRGRDNRNRSRNNGRNASRSPIRANRNDRDNRSLNNRAANPGRGNNANNRRGNQSRNRYRERDGASEFMDKLWDFFQGRN